MKTEPRFDATLAEQLDDNLVRYAQLVCGKPEHVPFPFYHPAGGEVEELLFKVDAILALYAAEIDACQLAQAEE
jgi:hypothetical protein